MANYGKQKTGKPAKNRPPHREHNEPGGPANPFGARNDKAALLDRMRAAAQRGQPGGTGGGPGGETGPGDAPEGRPEGEG
jgi:hypothetical protein